VMAGKLCPSCFGKETPDVATSPVRIARRTQHGSEARQLIEYASRVSTVERKQRNVRGLHTLQPVLEHEVGGVWAPALPRASAPRRVYCEQRSSRVASCESGGDFAMRPGESRRRPHAAAARLTWVSRHRDEAIAA